MQESTAHDIDSPAMRQAGRDGLSLALIDARNHTPVSYTHLTLPTSDLV